MKKLSARKRLTTPIDARSNDNVKLKPTKVLCVGRTEEEEEYIKDCMVWFWHTVLPNLESKFDLLSPNGCLSIYGDDYFLEVIKDILASIDAKEVSAAYLTRTAYGATWDDYDKDEQKELIQKTITYLRCWEIEPKRITRRNWQTGATFKTLGYERKQFKKAFASVFGPCPEVFERML